MKNARWLILPVLLLLSSGQLPAASFSGSMSRDSLMTARNLSWLGVGLNIQDSKRDISLDQAGNADLRARSVDAFLSVDVMPWLAVFGTVGTSAVQEGDIDEYSAFRFKWSAGVHFNPWHYDIQQPGFLNGRLSIKSTLEYLGYAADDVGFVDNEVEWFEFLLVVPVCYEIFEDAPTNDDPNLLKSINFYAGPAMSILDGTVGSGRLADDFEEDQRFGAIVGMDIFLAEKLSIGIQALLFDQEALSGTIRYHF